MTDSIQKDLLDLLNVYASWTKEPAWVQITDYKQTGVDTVARPLQDATSKMAFVIMPGVCRDTYEHGVHSVTWTFEFWLFLFEATHIIQDANRTVCQTFLTQMKTALRATKVTGFDTNFVSENTQEITNRDSDHLLFIGTITLKDWVA